MDEPKWVKYDDETLLRTRICDLKLKIEGGEIEGSIQQLYDELSERNLVFMPPCYLADEWLCPDGEPIIGIPFYLAHPILKKLEMNMIMEVEGGSREGLMKLLRHETGHAYNYAYLFHKKRKWRELFGPFSQEYPDTYVPRPYSKKYVRHIENWYAQYHPDEDFAETFAVWLTPGSNWREVYQGWKIALKKLEYVDSIMEVIKGRPPLVRSSKKYWSADKLKQTLGYYYRNKRRAYARDLPGFFDPDLKRIFRGEGSSDVKERADQFIKRYQRNIVKTMGMWTGKSNYLINKTIEDLILAAKNLDLYRYTSEEDTLLKIATYINTMVMSYLFTGRLK